MISIFAIPKDFNRPWDDSPDQQLIAINSWQALRPAPEIILLGDAYYVKEIAEAHKFKHVPDIGCNEHDTPLVNDVFAKGEAAASHDLVMYINADIVLPPDFMIQVARIASLPNVFAVGQRWDTDGFEHGMTGRHGWQHLWREKWAKQHAPSGLDYFIYRKGTLGEIPPFAIGRWVWDNWLMWNAHQRGLNTIDLSEALTIFHPDHPVAAEHGFQQGPEYEANKILAQGHMLNADHARLSLRPFQVSIFGLGKLGAPMLAGFVSEGIPAIGVDSDPSRCIAINDRRPPVQEPGLFDALQEGEVFATTEGFPAVIDTDASFIIVPTPSRPDGQFDPSIIQDVLIHEIGPALKRKAGYHLVVITSTVMPGDTEAFRGLLEEASGKVCGPDFGLCYSPEFIALGSVLHDWLNPDYVLIGESDPRAGDMLEAIYATVCHNNPPAVRTNFINAELAKIAQNAAIVAKLQVFNEFMKLCDNLPGADVDEVSRALGHDRRIGPHYTKGGLPPGGPCFPRDCRALIALAGANYLHLPVLEAVQDSLKTDLGYLANWIIAINHDDAPVGLVGLSYKPGTPVLEDSPSIHLAWILEQNNYRVLGYDPLVAAWDPFDMVDLDTLIAESGVIVLMHPDRGLALKIEWRRGDKIFIDPWRMLPAGVFTGTALGRGSHASQDPE